MKHAFTETRVPVSPEDQAVRACPQCGGELWWRTRQGVTWDRGLPSCPTHGLLSGWIILSRDGKRLLGLARVDNKGRVLAPGVELPIAPRSERNARHHFKKRPSPQRSLLAIDNHATGEIRPQTWPVERYGPHRPIEEVSE